MDPRECARMHYDTHVVKMCLEYAQILFTSARLRGFDHGGYKSTHKNHPCVQWATDPVNWAWLLQLTICLGKEYEKRFGRVHASIESLRYLPEELVVSAAYVGEQPSCFALAMPEEFYRDDAVASYRAYYKKGKAHLLKYSAPAVEPMWLS